MTISIVSFIPHLVKLHDTSDIIYQNSEQSEDSEDDVFEDVAKEIILEDIADNYDNQQSENDGNSNRKTRKEKRRRKFEAIVPGLQPFPMKVRPSETLLSS